MVDDNEVVTVRYRDPKYADDFIFEAKRLPNAIEPPTVLAPDNRPNDYKPQIGKYIIIKFVLARYLH